MTGCFFGSGYRSAGGDTVRIKRCLQHLQHCHCSPVDVFYCVNGFHVDSGHDRTPFVLVVA